MREKSTFDLDIYTFMYGSYNCEEIGMHTFKPKLVNVPYFFRYWTFTTGACVP